MRGSGQITHAAYMETPKTKPVQHDSAAAVIEDDASSLEATKRQLANARAQGEIGALNLRMKDDVFSSCKVSLRRAAASAKS